jgi:hypothetical protein
MAVVPRPRPRRKKGPSPPSLATLSLSEALALLEPYLKTAEVAAGSVRGVVGIISGIISENLVIAYYAARSNC